MPNAFEREFKLPLTKCCGLGDCCKGASPSTPYYALLKRAAEGDAFAQGFFSIMLPYPNHEAARKIVPGLVDRMLKAATKLENFNSPEDIVFYHCRYLLPDNRCGVHEDRPQFCRDYPDTPFVVMAPGCAFEAWGQACKEKYNALKAEVDELKTLKAELAKLKAEAGADAEMDSAFDSQGVDAPLPGSHNDAVSLSWYSSPLQSFLFRLP